jgi:3-keto-disaccharide hydrolase
MMKRAITVLAVLLGVAALAMAEPKATTDAANKGKWEKLFAGDLSDAVFPKGVWAVKDGLLSATKDECIWTKKQYENFTLDLEFKTVTNSNSGVIVYCSDRANWIPNSIEVQILDDFGPEAAHYPNTWKCAAIFGRLAPKKSMVKKPGQWNHITVVCHGKHITVRLNGETVTRFDMSKWTSAKKNPDGSDIPPWESTPAAKLATKGYVGLQGKHAGVPTYFRNVRIKRD